MNIFCGLSWSLSSTYKIKFRVVPDVIFVTGSDPAGYPDFFTGSGYPESAGYPAGYPVGYPAILPDNRIVI